MEAIADEIADNIKLKEERSEKKKQVSFIRVHAKNYSDPH